MMLTEVPVVRLHANAIGTFDAIVQQVRADQWTLPTPCSEWDVRSLVNHVVAEARWTAPLLAGRTIAEVGDSLDGDLLGDDPAVAWKAARDEAAAAAQGTEIGERIVHLSFGDTPAQEYLRQLTADYLVHAWDLAVAIGADDRLDAELVSAVAGWFISRASAYRSAGAIAAPVAVADGADEQRRLLALFGRDPALCATVAAVARFGAAFDRHDVDAVMAAMTEDCVFEATAPPDGVRHAGQAAVRAAWTEFFATAGDATFQTEEQFASGDRMVVRWLYTWAPGLEGHVRGVDIFRVRDGLVAEKVCYVKG
jgi:uncharacterized protein (TIGR03086 family)